jgi:hypothetical protein
MIVGNRKAGKRIATATTAILLILILIAAVVALRTAPRTALHPSLTILSLL